MDSRLSVTAPTRVGSLSTIWAAKFRPSPPTTLANSPSSSGRKGGAAQAEALSIAASRKAKRMRASVVELDVEVLDLDRADARSAQVHRRLVRRAERNLVDGDRKSV